MSAVSSESAADLSVPSATPSSAGNGLQTEPTDQGAPPANADFGPNEWLVDELYQRYLADPGSVDRAWWSFFADYRPVRATESGTTVKSRRNRSASTVNGPPSACAASSARQA